MELQLEKIKGIKSKIENKLIDEYKSQSELFLLLNTVNGKEVEALFTTKDKLITYMIRDAINMGIETFIENLEDEKEICNIEMNDDELFNAFLDYIRDKINDNYEILHVSHLDHKTPIYVVRNGNYRVYGKPEEYLTNSLQKWNESMVNMVSLYKEEIDKYIVKIDLEIKLEESD